MKLLILINQEPTLYKFRKELLAEMINLGYEVVISMPVGKNEDFFLNLGCRIIHTDVSKHGMNPLEDFRLPFVYRKIMLEEKPNVVITYTIKPNIYGGLAASWCKIPCISTITGLGAAFEKGSIIRKISCMLYRIGSRKTKWIFFQNPAQSELFKKYRIAVGRHKLVAGSGVNLKKHCFEEYPETTETSLLFIGRITKDKGINELIEAMRLVKAKTKLPISLKLLGNIEPGNEEKVALSEQEGLLAALGCHENVHDYVKDCSAVVLPSYHEGLANVLLEAAACGRPVIASKVNGCIETFDEGISGLGCNAKDANDLANVILKFAELSASEKAHMGLKGREKVEREYNREKVNQTYLDIIARLCKNR